METEWEKTEERTGLNVNSGNDELHMPFGELVFRLADCGERIEDPAYGMALTIEKVTLDLPVEIGINVDPEGAVAITGSPPTQRTETTFLPVFHRLALEVELARDGSE